MNGDVSKLPSGALYSSTLEPTSSNQSGPTSDQHTGNMMNGGMAVTPGEIMNEAGGGGNYIDINAAMPTSSEPAIPMETLKQMLSSQLEYYFSRYATHSLPSFKA